MPIARSTELNKTLPNSQVWKRLLFNHEGLPNCPNWLRLRQRDDPDIVILQRTDIVGHRSATSVGI